jgi:hypothetical protein
MHLYYKRYPAYSPRMVIALGLSVALASCSPSSPEAGGGIGGSGSVYSTPSISSGPVTKLGSIFVSGVEHNNSNGVYCGDSGPCSPENPLKLGMIVQVKGRAITIAPGMVSHVADTIYYRDTVEGVVQSVSPDASTLVVLGQIIALNPKTVIDASIPGRSIQNLTPNLDVIQVHGLVIGDGHLLATLIMKSAGTTNYDVEGVVKNHNAPDKRFEIGQLIVDYSSADIRDIETDGLTDWNGLLVHVSGAQWQPRMEAPYGARLYATRINQLALMVEDSLDARIEGFVMVGKLPGTFAINNHVIEVSASTRFEGGTIRNLALGAYAFVQGTLVQGVLRSQEVVFKENVEMESNVGSIDIQSCTFTLVGAEGLPITCDAQTVTQTDGIVSRIEDIRVGDHVKVHAKLLDGPRLLATEVVRTISSTTVDIQGPLQTAVDPQVQLLGISIDTSEIHDDEFVGHYGPMGRTAFFEKAEIGQLAWVKGTLSGSRVTWGSVGIFR